MHKDKATFEVKIKSPQLNLISKAYLATETLENPPRRPRVRGRD